MSFLVAALLATLSQETEPGLVAEYFALEGKPDGFPAFPAGRKPTFVRVEANISHAYVTGDFHGTKLAENFLARWTGTLTCEQEGLHNFYVESDDGCRLYIDDELVVDNATGQAMEQRADRIPLARGPHRIRFEYVQGSGPAGVNLQWKMPRSGRVILPAKFLSHPKAAENIDWDRGAWTSRATTWPNARSSA